MAKKNDTLPKFKRLTATVSEDLHAQIKSRSALDGMTIREYVLQVINKDLDKKKS